MMRCLVKLCVVKLIDENTYKVNIGCEVMHPLLIQYLISKNMAYLLHLTIYLSYKQACIKRI